MSSIRTRAAFAALLLGAAACAGPRARGPHATSPGRPALLSVPVVGSANQAGALSVAVATPRDARSAMLLASVLAERIGARGEREGLFLRSSVEAGFGADGARVTMPLASGHEAALVRLLRAAYTDPISAAESAALTPKERAYVAWPSVDPAESALARCRGLFHRADASGARDAATTQRELERARVGADGVALGVIAAAGDIERVRDALEANGRWGVASAGTAAQSAAVSAPANGTWWVHPALGNEARAHVLAWAPGRSARAQIALGRMLGEPGALGVPLSALGGGVRLERVDATLVPLGGACLAVSVAWSERTSEEAVAQAVALVRQRLAALSDEATRVAASTPALVMEGAVSPAQIAERAAQIALAERAAGTTDTRFVLEWPTSHGEPPAPTAQALAARLASEEAAGRSPRFALGETLRQGLPESWLLLASPCGTQGESEQDAGASAAYALAAAARASVLAGAAAEPWVEAGRVGLLLHAGVRPGETPGARAERLASAAARAWLGDGLELEAALRRLERADAEGLLDSFAPPSNPWRDVGLANPEGDAHGALAFGSIAALRPFGTTRSRRALREAAVRLRGETLAHGPLVAGYLAASGGEAERARAVLASTRSSTAPCPAPRTPQPAAQQPAASGGRLVRVPRGDTTAPLLVLLRVPEVIAPAALDALASYLDAAIARRLHGRLGAHRVALWGTSPTRVLALHLGVPAAVQDAALAEIRALFLELSSGRGVDATLWSQSRASASAMSLRQQQDFRLAAAAAWERAAALPATPRSEPPAAPPFATLLAPDNLVVIMPEP